MSLHIEMQSGRASGEASQPGPHLASACIPCDMRALLRQATARDHRRLDQSSVMAPLAQPGLTLVQYQQAMVALLRIYRRIDACLLQPPAHSGGDATTISAYLAHSPAMEKDLRATWQAAPASSPAASVFKSVFESGYESAYESDVDAGLEANHASNALPMPADLLAYLGMCYVIEGAQFGNRVIARNLRSSFGTMADSMCTSFLGESDTGWRDVMAALSALQSRREVAAAVRSARRTFRYFVINLGSVPAPER